MGKIWTSIACFVVIWKYFCFIPSMGTTIRINSVMRPRSSSRRRNTSASVTGQTDKNRLLHQHTNESNLGSVFWANHPSTGCQWVRFERLLSTYCWQHINRLFTTTFNTTSTGSSLPLSTQHRQALHYHLQHNIIRLFTTTFNTTSTGSSLPPSTQYHQALHYHLKHNIIRLFTTTLNTTSTGSGMRKEGCS